jgi:hypothetical protein
LEPDLSQRRDWMWRRRSWFKGLIHWILAWLRPGTLQQANKILITLRSAEHLGDVRFRTPPRASHIPPPPTIKPPASPLGLLPPTVPTTEPAGVEAFEPAPRGDSTPADSSPREFRQLRDKSFAMTCFLSDWYATLEVLLRRSWSVPILKTEKVEFKNHPGGRMPVSTCLAKAKVVPGFQASL